MIPPWVREDGRRLPLILLSVFAQQPLEGNLLAVLLRADAVGDYVQGRLARELRQTETVFVQSAEDGVADYRSRIWTVVEELPFAGHPTLGTAVAVALDAGSSDAAYVQQTASGRQRVRARLERRGWWASMTLPAAREGAAVPAEPVLAALGLGPSDAAEGLEVRYASAGLATLLVPLASRASLSSLRADRRAIASLGAGGEMFNLYAFAVDRGGQRVLARSFSSRPDEEEDPATGSAAAPLSSYLHRRLGLRRISIEQGLQVGHRSLIDCEVTGEGITVSGRVQVLARGELTVSAG